MKPKVKPLQSSDNQRIAPPHLNYFLKLKKDKFFRADSSGHSGTIKITLLSLGMLLFSLQGISQGSVSISGPGTVEAAENVIYQFETSGLPAGYEYHSHTWGGATWAVGTGFCGGPAFRGSTTVHAFNVRWGGGSTTTADVITINVKFVNPVLPDIDLNLTKFITIRRVLPFTIIGPTSIQQCCLTERSYSVVGYDDAVNLQGYSFSWTVPPGWSISGGHGTPNITVIPDNTTGGQVSCTVSRTFGGCAFTNSISVSRSTPSFGINFSSSTIYACEGLNVTINSNVPPCGGNPIINWTVPSGWNIVSGQNSATVTISPTSNAQNGTLTINGTLPGGCNVTSASRNLELLVEEPPNPVFIVLNPQNDMPQLNWFNGRWHVCPNGVATIFEVHPIQTAQSYTFSVSSPWLINGQTNPITTSNPWISVSGQSNAPITGVLTAIANNCEGSSDPVTYTFIRNDTNIPCGGGDGPIKARPAMNDSIIEEPVVYPNPFTHFIQIELPNLSEWRTWDIMDITGRMIKFGNISLTDENITIDTKDLNAGVYFIRIHDASGNAPAVFKSVKM